MHVHACTCVFVQHRVRVSERKTEFGAKNVLFGGNLHVFFSVMRSKGNNVLQIKVFKQVCLVFLLNFFYVMLVKGENVFNNMQKVPSKALIVRFFLRNKVCVARNFALFFL